MFILLAGPPCSGKSTLAKQSAAKYGGTVLDWDDVRAEITGLPPHDLGPDIEGAIAATEMEYRRRLEVLASTQGFIWVIRTAPEAQQRARWRRIYGARAVVCRVPPAVCLERLANSGRPEAAQAWERGAIARWWARYSPSRHDTTLAPWPLGSDPLERMMGSAPRTQLIVRSPRSRTVCSEPGCPNLADPGSSKCSAHRKGDMRAYDQRRGTAAQRGYDSWWKRIRDSHLKRHPWCVVCGAEARVVDHIRPRARGSPIDRQGQDSDANLQGLCRTHHASKTMTETNARRRSRL